MQYTPHEATRDDARMRCGDAQRAFFELTVRRAPLDDFLHALREMLNHASAKKGRPGPVRWERNQSGLIVTHFGSH